MTRFNISPAKLNSFGIEQRVIFAVAVVTIFCMVFIYMHPYSKIKSVQASSTSEQEKNKLPKSASQLDPSQLTHLPPVVVDNSQASVLNSANTQSPQNNNANSNANLGRSSSNFDLQASVTKQDPDSLNISVPKIQINTNKLTNLVK